MAKQIAMTSDKKILVLNDTVEGLNTITVDSALSDSSTNPVENKVVKAAIDAVETKIDNKQDKLDAATEAPKTNGTAAVGTSAKYAREDHVHPSDDTKLSLSGGEMTGELDLSGSAEQEITKLFWKDGIFNLSAGLGNNPHFKFNTDPSGGETTLSSGRVFSETGYYYGGSITLNQGGVIISGKGGDVEITNVKNPTSDTDAANKAYVDSVAATAISTATITSTWNSVTV